MVCSSTTAPAAGGAAPYNSQSWLAATSPIVVAPVLDPVTGGQVVVISYPISGLGAVVWLLDLVPIGPGLASEFGNAIHSLDFMITSPDDKAASVRSMDAAQWGGNKLSGAPAAAASAGARTQRSHQNLSGEARSASEDPGGRTDGLHGFKRRNEEWSRSLEPARRKRNPGAVASRDDRM